LALVGSFADRLGALDLRLVVLAVILQLANVAGRSVAWRNVLRAAYPTERVALGTVACAYAAGTATNALAPAHAGELVKAALLRTRIHGSCLTTIGATMAVITLFDGGMALVALAGAAAFGALPATPSLPVDPLLVLPAIVAVAAVSWLVRHRAGRLAGRLRGIGANLAQGVAIMRSPGRYVWEVAAPLAAAWCARVGVVFLLLQAFSLPATLGTALVVVVVGSLSTAVPMAPGGAGAQQAMMIVALRETASAASVLSFSIGMQAGVTLLHVALGLAATMVLFRTLRPACAVQAGRRLVRASGD
jgi:uncharacterized membrane protein YbhN (UPF0104 family)